jgi:hypothetical protein
VKRRAAVGCLLLAIAVAVAGCASGKKRDREGADEQAAALSALPDPAALARVAQQRGLVRCLPRIGDLASRLLEGADYRADVMTAPEHPYMRLFAAMISRQGARGVHQFVSLAVAPDAVCSSAFGITTAWAIPCEQVASGAFERFHPAARLSGNVAVLQHESGTPQVFLMPIHGGCLSLERAALY